jgi:predicted O-methyltransferase YrrM
VERGDLTNRARDALRRLAGPTQPPGGEGAPVRIELDSPPSADPRPRWGHGRRRHPAIAAYLARHDDAHRRTLESVLPHIDSLAAIPARSDAPAEPHWQNAFLPGMDLAVLYALVRDRAPRRYIEVGSGHSTMVARQAIADGGLATRIVSVDPEPRAEVDALCDERHRVPLEQLDLGELEVEEGDVVFYDGSHRVFTSSDAVVFYLDLLPGLPPGTLVEVHDVLWPDDYLPEWRELWFAEQVLLGAMLLGDPAWLRPVLAAHHAATDPELSRVLEPLWDRLGLELLDRRGFGFWFEVTASPDAG